MHSKEYDFSANQIFYSSDVFLICII